MGSGNRGDRGGERFRSHDDRRRPSGEYVGEGDEGSDRMWLPEEAIGSREERAVEARLELSGREVRP